MMDKLALPLLLGTGLLLLLLAGSSAPPPVTALQKSGRKVVFLKKAAP